MTSMPIIVAMCSMFAICDYADAAARVAVRGNTTTARKSVTENIKKVETTVEQEVVKEEPVIINKSSQFDVAVNEIMDAADSDNSFAAEIRKQRAAIAAAESKKAAEDSLNNAIRSGSNTCDIDLRKCMIATCGNDFTKCALDGDTDFGEKLNKCKRDTTCSGNEFSLFSKEIKDDRDMNMRLASFSNVINCGNQYNACIMNECGTTYNKCLGKANADAAIEKCKTIATECAESDSGLVARFGTAIGLLRDSAESEIVNDEKKLYDLRDSMRKACTTLGAAFDERSFDCVYTVNFFAGDNQDTPTASRKAYAGDTFTCMQEWFGVNATTFKENAYRETRSQTAASSAMLGSGLGTAAGLITSGAINRALDTQKAKKELDKETCKQKQNGTWTAGACYCNGVMMLKNDMCDGKKIQRGALKDEDKTQLTDADCNGGKAKAGSCWCGAVIMTKHSTCDNGKITYRTKDGGAKDTNAGGTDNVEPESTNAVPNNKQQKKADTQINKEIAKMKAMVGTIKIGTTFGIGNQSNAFLSASQSVKNEYYTIRQKLTNECKKITGATIESNAAKYDVKCICDNKSYDTVGDKCVKNKDKNFSQARSKGDNYGTNNADDFDVVSSVLNNIKPK